MQSLAEAKTGELYTIKWMIGNPQVMDVMGDYDIREGSTVQVIQRVMDSVIVGVHDMRVAIGNEVAERIKV